MNNKKYQLENEIKEIKLKINQLSKLNLIQKQITVQDPLPSNLKSESLPLESYKVPILIGLNNIGAACFMNSTLQCLSQTKDLTNFFFKR